MYRILCGLLLVSVLTSCKKFVYHTNEVRPDVKNLNATNIQKITGLPVQSNYKFILIGDTQRFYEELDAFVGHVNSLDDVAFILLNGDLVDFGLNSEFNWVAERLQRINIPYVTAIGNHDMIANGRAIYKEMFGPENFSFVYSGSKFIVLNTNSRETNFDKTIPDMPWLTDELQDGNEYTNVFVLSHVAPFSTDFDKEVEPAFASLLKSQPKVRVSLHGHEHTFSVSQPYNDGLTYIVAASTEKRSYVLVTVQGTSYLYEEKVF